MSDISQAICGTCGAAVPAGATFCPTCGAAVAATSAPPGGRPALTQQETRAWAMGVHLSALAGAFVGGLGSWVGPLVIWLIRREDDPFVAEHAREGLNFNITMAILVAAGVLFSILTIGIGLLVVLPFWLVIGVLWFIWTIQATLAANRGERYRYPLSLRLIT